jgi:transcriptional regulator with XRE-family HTH domain
MQGFLILREARHRVGLSQEALAARLGTTQSAVARWESGAVSPRLDTLERILEACGFEPRVPLQPLSLEDRDQIRQRLAWSPRRRLDYLKAMLAFEKRARHARPARPH